MKATTRSGGTNTNRHDGKIPYMAEITRKRINAITKSIATETVAASGMMNRGLDVFVTIGMFCTRLSDPSITPRDTKIQTVSPLRAKTGYGIPGMFTFARWLNAKV